ncbi:arginine--tRNA ligase [Wenyingzhuangia marina]|uniref:Arginine--tRNA ligase n=1 Tax=Wenyingzhuangia marina TaxID=1195760 RepID=A0A1M5VFF5_9FLAO|nr:arginine--tRNA ligase [Wenyingzhuangia marina]GGF72464.1 arginine--tRNA ligase [Wenyingzhuangia marina]SHH73979.1 arginyl-tRNA synthetase [Wenyingzhuangia marina]
MSIQNHLEIAVKKAFVEIFETEIPAVEFQATRKEFDGDITIVVFAFLRFVKGNPVQIGTQIGEYLKTNVDLVTDFNVVKGFLNISINPSFFVDSFYGIYETENYGTLPPAPTEKAVMVEYSSPNTNKPLHLGHVRNNLLGFSVAEIIAASGKKVYKTQIINDRGIHICKSMLAWQKFGNGETPENTGLKGDKLVGNYYVAFDKAYKEEINNLIAQGRTEEEAKKQAPILLEAQEMLRKWEAGDEEVVNLWKTMNQWVYDGFAVSYKNLGVEFDKNYYESETYLLGKDCVQDGLEKGVFYKKEDGSVWIDLTDEGLDEKLVLRGDGTSVYITQDLGTAIQRFQEFDINALTYTVGNEQDYHFKVLFLILKKLGFSWAENMYHLSYGMVDLPTGKMKSREGTVVDADDLMEEMVNTAREISQELGKLEGYSEEKKEELYKIIGMGALKYYILKVDPKKRILFDPKESIDFNGNTGPFIQYTYARIQSILRKADFDYTAKQNVEISDKELAVIKTLQLYPETVQLAAKNHSPALIANYTYDLVKEYNSFYQSSYILGCEEEALKVFRTQLSAQVGDTIKSAFKLLGIEVPERM